jgi:hypothetical protein
MKKRNANNELAMTAGTNMAAVPSSRVKRLHSASIAKTVSHPSILFSPLSLFSGIPSRCPQMVVVRLMVGGKLGANSTASPMPA